MMTTEILQRLALALAIGLLIGIERGWREREGKPGSRAAGIRTHTLIGLLGGVWGLVGAHFGDVVLGLGAAAFILAFAAFEWREGVRNDDVSATGMVAAILAFGFGVYAIRGDMLAAASAGVVTTLVLAERELLHGFLKKLQWNELRSGVVLLVMTVVLLPVLPNETVDPWDAINPFQIWLATVLIAALSFGGYIAVRLAGPRKGPLYAGVAGGLISSTTVTWTFARLAGEQKNPARPLAAAITASWSISLVRTAIVALAIAPALLPVLGPPVGVAASVFAVAVFLFHQRDSKHAVSALKLEHPFELLAVLRFGALIALILILTKVITAEFGHSGLFGLAAITGLADVDPVTISVAQAAGRGVDMREASLVILTAATANLVAKCGIAFAFGKIRFAAPLLAVAGLAVGLAAATALLL